MPMDDDDDDDDAKAFIDPLLAITRHQPMIPSLAARIRLTSSPPAEATSYLACNIYVSLGGHASHRPLLRALLHQAQAHCRILQDVMVVHTYTDGVYNRSSFHLAGKPNQIASVATDLTIKVFQNAQDEDGLHLASATSEATSSTAHPTVGLVDHIAVMPLEYSSEGESTFMTTNAGGATAELDAPAAMTPLTPSAIVAQSIGQMLQSKHSEHIIHYYGDAHPNTTPLATIRREHTDFFRTSSSRAIDVNEEKVQPAAASTITIGAPSHGFVENYNIRLTATCPRTLAKTLTKRIRQESAKRVEALTLPYSRHRQEVACNLLQPRLCSAEQLQAIVKDWEAEQATPSLVEVGYRVGTTVDQCLEALSAMKQDRRREYDDDVRQQQEEYLSQN